eukprot:GHUV01035335.1.p1 GENE.GHUV01035335.1~~GHUV01035335.1.p1  ORF type:complete len:154 (-),score=36.18 GHUV01035335.1:190-651(-)
MLSVRNRISSCVHRGFTFSCELQAVAVQHRTCAAGVGVCKFELQPRWQALVGPGWCTRLEPTFVGLGEEQISQQHPQHKPARQPSSAGELQEHLVATHAWQTPCSAAVLVATLSAPALLCCSVCMLMSSSSSASAVVLAVTHALLGSVSCRPP